MFQLKFKRSDPLTGWEGFQIKICIMKKLFETLKGWQSALEEKEKEVEEKLDLREDGQSGGVDVNSDGVVDGEDTHYSPDKKQDARKKDSESRRGLHR